MSIDIYLQKSIEKEPVKLKDCECRAEVVREFGILRFQGKCRSFYCLKSSCVLKLSTSSALKNHLNNAHFKDADRNQCFHCKGVKDRKTDTNRSTCPRCQANWCLKGDCTFETQHYGSFTAHFRLCQK